MKIKYLLILIFVLFTSCTSNSIESELLPDYETSLSPNFIQEYFIPDSVIIDEYPEDASHSADNEVLEILFWGKSINERIDPKQFEDYARLYGDTMYGYYVQPGSNFAVAEAFRKISVVSDTDFDAEHLAGTPLDDIICLRSESAYEYIRSGYKQEDKYVNCRKTLDELKQDDMTLMRYTAVFKKNPWDKQCYAWGGYNISGLEEDKYNNLTLSFRKYPEKADIHKLTFTFTKADGTKIKNECRLDFKDRQLLVH